MNAPSKSKSKSVRLSLTKRKFERRISDALASLEQSKKSNINRQELPAAAIPDIPTSCMHNTIQPVSPEPKKRYRDGLFSFFPKKNSIKKIGEDIPSVNNNKILLTPAKQEQIVQSITPSPVQHVAKTVSLRQDTVFNEKIKPKKKRRARQRHKKKRIAMKPIIKHVPSRFQT